MKRLYKSETDKKLCGVCGGVAEYINLDSTIVRLVTAVGIFCTAGTGLLLYLIAALIMPNQSEVMHD